MTPDIHPGAIESLLNCDHGAPFDLLGPHAAGKTHVSVRAFQPAAQELALINDETGQRTVMTQLHNEGFFEATVEGTWPGLAYHLEARLYDGQELSFADPYAYGPMLTDFDLHLFSEGNHLDVYEKLGAHRRSVNGVTGVNFALWAPNAFHVSVVGDFNGWDARRHPMQVHGTTGIWELFVPGLTVGESYKFDIRSRQGGYQTEKSDPYGFASELRPRTASIVADLGIHTWGDADWMAARAERDILTAPMSIYEVHLGSWRRKPDGSWLTYSELAEELVEYVQRMNYTHIELMPVAEHPLDASWGYQVTGYFAATSRYGSPAELMFLIDQCHQAGIGVILDWVPAHFPKDGHGLSFFDGTHLYEHADTRKGEHPDWGTYIFNYGRNEVRNFLISNALFWLKKYHIDGLRVDAVSSMLYLDFSRENGQWLPNEYGGNENLQAIDFMKRVNEIVHSECPGAFTVAEESTAWPMVSRPTYLGGLGFTFKWNMGWMHDTLDYIRKDPVYRRYAHNHVTFSLVYAFSENFVLSLSHDEVVHGKGSLINKIPGDWWQKFASLRLLFGYQYTHPGKKLNFMGQEFGQWQEWSEERGLDWHLLDWDTHQKVHSWVRDLNRLYQSEPALYEYDFDYRGFRWIEPNDIEQSVFSFLRFAKDSADFVVVACNFTPVPRHNYRIGVPESGYYIELINSDAGCYGGGNLGNLGGVYADALPWHAFDHSLEMTIPPLSMVVLKLQR